MKNKMPVWLGILTVLVSAAPAAASVTRTADGDYQWSNVVYTDQTGRVLGTESTSYTQYSNAVGVYGGGDTASGRMTAKNRAINKALACTAEFFFHDRLYQWTPKCTVDATVYSRFWSTQSYSALVSQVLCDKARGLATQAGYYGPVYVAATVKEFGDAAGTEADVTVALGSFAYHVCY